jgi:hypothetical protein
LGYFSFNNPTKYFTRASPLAPLEALLTRSVFDLINEECFPRGQALSPHRKYSANLEYFSFKETAKNFVRAGLIAQSILRMAG